MRESLLQQSVNRITIRWISLFADIVENLVIKLKNVTGCSDFFLDSSLIKLKFNSKSVILGEKDDVSKQTVLS